MGPEVQQYDESVKGLHTRRRVENAEWTFADYLSVRCTKHIIAHSQTIRSSLLLLFLSVHNKPYTNWEIYHERLAFSCYRNSWRSNRNIRIKI